MIVPIIAINNYPLCVCGGVGRWSYVEGSYYWCNNYLHPPSYQLKVLHVHSVAPVINLLLHPLSRT